VILGVLLVVALAGGLTASVLVVRWPPASALVALVGSGVALLAAVAAPATASVAIGETSLALSEAGRILAISWSAGLLLLGLIGVGTADEDGDGVAAVGGTIGAGLVALGGGLVAISVGDLGLAFAALGTGTVAALVLPAFAAWLGGHADDAPLHELGAGLLPCLGATLAGMALVAWSGSAGGPPVAAAGPGGLEPVAAHAATGLGVVAMASAMVLRAGAIPGHLWAARLVGMARPIAIPTILGWGGGVFTLLAVGWSEAALAAGGAAGGVALDDLDRWLILAVALASILLGSVAALLHDDIEHVLGYSIVLDAGVALLALAAVRPDVAGPVATWVIASAGLKAALAGWIGVTRWAFGAHRVTELRGWARRAPVLAAAYAVVLVGSVGLPGMASFDARVALASGALPGWPGTLLVAIATLGSLAALGRVLAAGFQQPSGTVAAAPVTRLGVLVSHGPARGSWSSGSWLGTGLRRAPGDVTTLARENRGMGVAIVAVLLAVVGFTIALVGAGRGLAA
jgi:NADH:ubiquinone oxidoreductase subunit 2 (subunit N)